MCKTTDDRGVDLQIAEIFTSIQGEGSAQGLPCVFVRLAGCPLRCRWCDTAWARAGGEAWPLQRVVAHVVGEGIPRVEITGGEPLSQEATPTLARALIDEGLDVLCETSGAFDIGLLPAGVMRVVDLKPPGSGETDRMRWRNVDALRADDDLKFVLADRVDYEWARRVIVDHALAGRCTLLMSAVAPALPSASLAAWILEDRLDVRLQVQLHKVLWPGEDRGR